jgi:hypothetical protein
MVLKSRDSTGITHSRGDTKLRVKRKHARTQAEIQRKISTLCDKADRRTASHMRPTRITRVHQLLCVLGTSKTCNVLSHGMLRFLRHLPSVVTHISAVEIFR